VDLMEVEVDLMVEEDEVGMVDLIVDEVDLAMMVDEVDMEVEEDTATEEDMAVEEEEVVMEVEEGTDHLAAEEVDLLDPDQEVEDTVQDHQSEELEEGIVQNTVERGDILHPDPGRYRAGAEAGVRHQGGRKASVGVEVLVGRGREAGLQWVERGVIVGVSAGVGAGVGVGRPCPRSDSGSHSQKVHQRALVHIGIACR
jgi:hypothetical protein